MQGSITGIYCDSLYPGSDTDSAPLASGWQNNRIVRTSDVLIATLMKGEPDTGGILYLAIGAGEPSWDGSNPIADADTVQLANEVLRHQILPTEMEFIDALGQLSATPTNRIRVTVDFIGADIVSDSFLSLREFGLCGGDADANPDSGQLINYVIHPRIDFTPNATLTRELRISFDNSLSASEQNRSLLEVSPQWLRESPLRIIDGVGEFYSTRLASASIITIEELSNLENTESEVDIPALKLVEFRTKAQLALQTMSEFQNISGLQNSSVRELMSTPVAELAVQAGETPGNVQRMTQQLSQLQVAMDDDFIRDKSLTDLVHGSTT